MALSYRSMELIGSGQFGQVYKGVWKISDASINVAVKMLKPGADESARVRFLREAAIMGQFFHHNVVHLYGVVTIGEPVSTNHNNDTACTHRHTNKVMLLLFSGQCCLRVHVRRGPEKLP